jgi:hypothetical protein
VEKRWIPPRRTQPRPNETTLTSRRQHHVPVNADVHEIETMFVEEDDRVVNPLGVKGMGELGMVGIPAAIATQYFMRLANASGSYPSLLRSCCNAWRPCESAFP